MISAWDTLQKQLMQSWKGNAEEENHLQLLRKKRRIQVNPEDARKVEDASNGILFFNESILGYAFHYNIMESNASENDSLHAFL